MVEYLDGYRTYQSDGTYRTFQYFLEGVEIKAPKLSEELAFFPGGAENLYRLLLGVLFIDGNVAWSPNAPSHPAILRAEGKTRGEVSAYFQIDHPVNKGPSKIIITGIEQAGMEQLTRYVVTACPDSRSQLCIQQVDNLPEVGSGKKFFQGTVGRYEFLENLSRKAPSFVAKVYRYSPI